MNVGGKSPSFWRCAGGTDRRTFFHTPSPFCLFLLKILHEWLYVIKPFKKSIAKQLKAVYIDRINTYLCWFATALMVPTLLTSILYCFSQNLFLYFYSLFSMLNSILYKIREKWIIQSWKHGRERDLVWSMGEGCVKEALLFSIWGPFISQ